MENPEINNMSDQALKAQIERTEWLLKLDHQQWKSLGLYQSFHQELFKVVLNSNLKTLQAQLKTLLDTSSEPESEIGQENESILDDSQPIHEFYNTPLLRSELLEQVNANLDPKQSLLFTLTGNELIDELGRTDWLSSQEEYVTLNTSRWYQLKKQVVLNDHNELQITVLTSAHQATHTRQKTRREEETILEKRAERLKKSLEYIDPLQHISKANETPFTIRRLDLILTSLDGLVVKQDSFRDLLNINPFEFETIFDATDRLGLTRRTEDGYIRLDFHGTSLARQERPKRLKALSMIASRLRREAKLQAEP